MIRALCLVLTLAATHAFAVSEEAAKRFKEWADERIETLAKDPDPDARAKAATYLDAYNDYPAAIAALGAALGDREAKVRAAAASAFWKMGAANKAAIEPARASLVKALDDPAPEVVIRAAGALSWMGMKEAELAPARRRVLDSKAYIGDRFMAARTLIGLEPNARLLEVMLEWLEYYPSGPNADNTALALARLVKTGDRSLIPRIKEAADKDKKAAHVLNKILALYDKPQPKASVVSKNPIDLFQALMRTDVEAVRAMLDAGQSAKDPVASGGPPLYTALQWSPTACAPTVRPTAPATIAMVKLLLEHGADAAAADANGNTPLMAAAAKGCDREVMKLLLKAGAKVEATNRTGLTAFEQGLFYGHDGLEEIIAAGYRLPAAKVAPLEKAYAAKPASLALLRKAARK